MKRGKKVVIGLIVFACIVTILLAAAVTIAPWLIDHTTVGNKVRSEVSKLVGGEFDFKEIDLSFFPAPHAVLTNPEINLPQQLVATAEAIEIYPEFLPLLTGRFSLKTTLVKRPEATITVPISSGGNRKSFSPTEINGVIQPLWNVLAKLQKSYLPINHGVVTGGSIALIYGSKNVFTLHDVEVDLRNVFNDLTFQITAAADIFDSVSVAGSINAEQEKNSLHVALEKVQLGTAYTAFLPDAELKIDDGATDVTMDFTMEHDEQITMDFTSTTPNVRFDMSGQTADIKIERLSGSLEINADSTKMTLSELLVDNPSMRVSGNLLVSEEDPKFRLHLEGRDMDVNSIRSVALAMTAGNTAVQTVFEILKGGTIPLLSVSGQADTPGGLIDLDNLVLKASLADGEIDIPRTNLALTGVSGDVGMSKGILAGKNVMTQWQGSMGKNGTFTLDLMKEPLPLHVEAGIDFDVADLPAILANFKVQALNTELTQIEDLQGSANGKLLLDGTIDHLKVAVSATDVQLAGRYHRIPYPLTIAGGSVTYEGDRLQWEQLNGTVGESSFAEFSGNLDFEKTVDFKILSGTSRILVPELLPWLASYEKMRELSHYYGGGEAILQLSKVTLGGPVKDPHKWHFDIAGEAEDLVIQNLPRRPGPIKVATVKFNVTPHQFDYSDGQMSMLDSTLTMSGKYRHYQTWSDRDVSLFIAGKLGPKTTQWLSQNTKSPSWLKLRPNLLTTSHISYSNQGERRLTVTLAFQEDLEVFADVIFNADDVVVEKFTIKDGTYQATLDGTLKDQSVDFSFNGIVHESTLSKLFQPTANLRGSIAGRAHIRLNLKNLYDVSLDGGLNGENLSVPLNMKTPLTIHTIVLKGVPEKIELTSADLSWSDMRLTLSGNIMSSSSEALQVDLDIETGTVDVEKIMARLGDQNKSQDQEPAATFFPLPIQGNIRFNPKQLKTRKLTIQPLQADIRLQKNSADITLIEAGLCGIPISGTFELSPQSITFHLKPEARAQQFNTVLDCFVGQEFKADGTFDVEGTIEGHGTVQDLLKSSSGQVDLSISDGHIYHDIILLNVVKFLSPYEIIVEGVTAGNMKEKGLGFKRFETQVTLQNGKLRYEKFTLDSNLMTITGAGEIDVLQNQIDFTLLVTPQKAVNTILGHIPLIGGIFQTIASIPLSVGGTFDSVHVLPLAPSADAYELKEIMEQIVGVPIHLVHIDEYHQSANNGKE